MIAASDAWVAAHEQNVLPETFVEIAYGAVDAEAQIAATATATNEAVFSHAENVTSISGIEQYATLEHNLWSLGGTRRVLSEDEPRIGGYTSQDDTGASITLSFPAVMTQPVPGLTIVWSSEYDEYPTSFTVTAKNGDAVVATATVADNTEVTSVVNLELVDYDSITITAASWCVPEHRVRVDSITMGMGLTFTKKDIVSFTHEQEGDLCSGALPKNSVTFELDNTTGRWNPDNPQGIEKYLSERQEIKVRYGMRVGDGVEWLDAGTFYLSEWSTSPQGMTATITARDVFEFLVNEPFQSGTTGTLFGLIDTAYAAAHDKPGLTMIELNSNLLKYTATTDSGRTAAEIIQLCANAGGCVIRAGWGLSVNPLSTRESGYTIERKLTLAHPEIALSKPLRSVAVSYGDSSAYTLDVAASGVTQTVDNPLITTEAQAKMVAEKVRNALITRKTVSGEYRADPRLELYDIVAVESKYGVLYPVALTNITYTYTGSFWAKYTGHVLPTSESAYSSTLGSFVLGRSALG